MITNYCLVCESKDDLVNDHNHETGMIRGTLCRRCNSWVGVYESNKRKGIERGRRRYKEWVTMYIAKIEEHLLRDTGQHYGSKTGWLLDFVPIDADASKA